MISISMVDSRSVRRGSGSTSLRAPDAVDHGDQDERQDGRRGRPSPRRGVAAVERDHDAGQQDHEGQHPRQRGSSPHAVAVLRRGSARSRRCARAPPWRRRIPSGSGRPPRPRTGDQQQARPDAGEEQPAERLLGGHRIEDHGDRGRQQDAERAAGRDDAGREAAGE